MVGGRGHEVVGRRSGGVVRRARRGVLAALALVGVLVLAPSPRAASAAPACPDLFPPALVNELARQHPGVQFTAAVHDTATGCWFHLNRGLRLTTASVIKAQVLGAVLLRAQDQGRSLTAWERSQIDPMIRNSFNPETANLVRYLGGWPGLAATDAAFGATATTYADGGRTASTAEDRTNAALRLLYGGGRLGQAGRDEAWRYLSSVNPLQEWGISAGVPHGWTVAQKNGFYPLAGQAWRTGSSGFVRRDGSDQGYAITVMTYGGGDQSNNVRLVEALSRRAASLLTVGPAASRPVDRARCVRTEAGETWAGVAARVGLPASRAGAVRDAAGGNASPLSGQRACSTTIPAEPRAAGSTVNGRFVPVASDLSCDGRDDLLWYGPGAEPDALWEGSGNRRFRDRATSVSGDYLPVGGDFDGDGCGDVFWYGVGGHPDVLWSGGATRATSYVRVDGSGFVPRSGDFDGDGHDDILWYRPGSGADAIWFGQGRGSFAKVPVAVNGAFEPVIGDYDGDGADDIFWYAPGTGAEAFWRGVTGHRRFVVQPARNVSGRYRPVAADLDGDGADELLWYAPGTAPDLRWDGLPSIAAQTSVTISGDYLPLAGDLDGDGHDDVAWYGPGGAPEAQWWGTDAGYASGPLTR